MTTTRPVSTPSIDVIVNGDAHSIPEGLSVHRLLEHLGLDPRLIVVEKNRVILQRDGYAEAPVHEGDALELVQFVGGG